MTKQKFAFWDVDTQRDFMLRTGGLYVPEAEQIAGGIATLTEYARQRGIHIFGSLDAHTVNDPEFKQFPAHCVKGTWGFHKALGKRPGEIYFEKNTIDVFTNPEAERAIVETAQNYAVYGVATDFCVRAVVLGMQNRGIQAYAVEDAIRGVFPDKTQQAIEEMKKAGARFIKIKDVLEGKLK
jgi:nicotinamidase/pyrazinamidase